MVRLRSKLVFLAGFGLGYYVGTGSGEERRRQIDDLIRRVEDNPTLGKLRQTLRTNADEVAGVVSDRVAETFDAAGHRVADAVDGAGDSVGSAVSNDRSG